jgi:hypothetical protein
MAFKTAETTLASAVATSGTFTVGYPDGTDSGHFTGAFGHKMWVSSFQTLLSSPSQFTLTFGTSSITVTYLGTTTIPAGARVSLQIDGLGSDDRTIKTRVGSAKRTSVVTPVLIALGAPDVADADGVCASQTITTTAAINGALASGGVATFDQPRNIVAAWTGTAVLTFNGTDEYGNAVREASASGTSHAGKKAFKTVTSITTSAEATSATVGTGDVFGLPVFIAGSSIVRELQDGVLATAGTIAIGISATATATTGDVRGTYDPNAAADGAKSFQLYALVQDPSYTGGTQFSG